MKKLALLISLVGIPLVLSAGDVIVDSIGPTSVTQQDVTTTISAPGAKHRNCLTEFSISVSSNAIVRILAGSTTDYAVDVATTTPFTSNIVVGQPLRMTWPIEDPFCGDYNESLSFTVLNSTGSSLPHKLNYRGHIRAVK